MLYSLELGTFIDLTIGIIGIPTFSAHRFRNGVTLRKYNHHGLIWARDAEQVHRSYYEHRIPAAIKDKEYKKPQASLFIDAGEVKQQYVEGLPLRTISSMTFGEAHGEVER
jgi:hypothetical protein